MGTKPASSTTITIVVTMTTTIATSTATSITITAITANTIATKAPPWLRGRRWSPSSRADGTQHPPGPMLLLAVCCLQLPAVLAAGAGAGAIADVALGGGKIPRKNATQTLGLVQAHAHAIIL